MRKGKSLYFRLLVIFGVTFLLIMGLFGLHRHLNDEHRPGLFHKNLNNYGRYILNDLRGPEGEERGQQIARDLSLDLRFEGPGVSWATRDELQAIDLDSFPSGRAVWRHGQLLVEEGEYRLLLSAPRVKQGLNKIHLFILLGVLIVFVLSYHMVQRSLRPLRELESAAHQIAEGDYEVRVREPKVRELGAVVSAFNGMIEKISSNLEGWRQLLGAVSHEVRSPLARMKVALEFVEDEKIRQSLNEEIDQLDEMTFQLLEVERLRQNPQGLDKHKTDLTRWLSETLSPYSQRGVDLSIDAPPSLEANIDSERMRLVLRNLIENSLKHGKPPIKIALETDGDQVVLTVSDQGPGFVSEVLERWGEAFYRPDPSRSRESGGFGLGLSLCLAIIKAHGGQIQVTNPPTGGAKTQILIPRV